jgi:hypothetical protein
VKEAPSLNRKGNGENLGGIALIDVWKADHPGII